VAIIASPAPFHLGAAAALADQGTHLLIEKPLAASTDGVEAFLNNCVKNNVLVQVGYNLRFLETLQKFRDVLKTGCIGKVQSVRSEIGQYLPGWRPGKDYRQTVSAQRKLGGGVLLELSHELDFLRWTFGEVDWVSSWSGQLGALNIDVEDCAHLNLGFASGVVGNVCMDFLRHDTTRCCTAIAEAGTLRWDAVAGDVSLFSAGTNEWQTLLEKRPDRDASYREQIKLFLAAIPSGKVSPYAATGADGLAVLRLIEAARKSIESSGQVTSIPKDRTE
jgi:predicted dehydrogenase